MRSLTEVHYFVKSKTPEGISREQRRNNLRHKTSFVYSAPVFVNGEWFSWYLLDKNVGFEINEQIKTKETKNDIPKK